MFTISLGILYNKCKLMGICLCIIAFVQFVLKIERERERI